MAKTKTPFFGLGSQGSLGNTLTSQKRNSSTLLRNKPTPTDRYTLPQAYQRWLYEDYAYLWRQQSQATQAEYRSAGVRHHLTGFQYWMKYHLTNLPDIAAWWKLDEKSGAIIRDSSRNLNHGTIIGASPTTLAINGALYFDGINDSGTIPHSPSLNLTDEITILMFINWKRNMAWRTAIDKYTAGVGGYQITRHADFRPYFAFIDTAGAAKWSWQGISPVPTLDTLYAIAGRYNHVNVSLFLNGQLYSQLPFTGDIAPTTKDLQLSWNGAGAWADQDLDDIIIYNRALDDTEIERHSSRRYPP